jgi:hypothetical protein
MSDRKRFQWPPFSVDSRSGKREAQAKKLAASFAGGDFGGRWWAFSANPRNSIEGEANEFSKK